MTTSWALATHGRLMKSLQAHVMGTLLAPVAMVVGLGATIVAARGKRLVLHRGDTMIAVFAVTLVVLVLFEWIVRLVLERSL